MNGRAYEAFKAFMERRRPFDLYHSALEVHVPEGSFVIETAWPIPDDHPASRGVVVEAPVGSRRIARFRAFRYEVHRSRDGVIPDLREAVASPKRLSDEERDARRLLELVGSVPALVWGRDELETGENVELELGCLVGRRSERPAHGRDRAPTSRPGPGWEAGIALARRGRHG